ncbi:MAG: uridine kinase [Bdellovibrionales bacterium]|nr:uridine kinase [Bdellovibrionales bacterium]
MFLVGIAGGSGSGKTTFAKKIVQRVQSPVVAHFSQDSYYLPSPPQKLQINGESNFDHPDAFDWPLLRSHLEKLKRGESVEMPIYDYKISRRSDKTQKVGPCKALLMEGIFTLWDEEIRNLFDIRVYLHVEADIRFIRRLHRDVRERGRSLDGIIRQYYDTVRPMHHEFLEPTKQYADIVVGEETDIAAEVISARVKELAL